MPKATSFKYKKMLTWIVFRYEYSYHILVVNLKSWGPGCVWYVTGWSAGVGSERCRQDTLKLPTVFILFKPGGEPASRV